MGFLLGYVRQSFTGDVRRNCSVTVALVKKWGLAEAERMVRGAQLLGWQDLVSLNAKDGLGRRWALAKWTDSQKGAAKMPDQLKEIMREASQ